MKCISARDMMKGLWINESPDCEKTICQINDILMDHYDLLVGSETTKVGSWFTWSWLHTINSINWEEILRLNWVYVTTCSCCPMPCMHKTESCSCCESWYSLELCEAVWDLEVWHFAVDCDKVHVNVWDKVIKWYVNYSKWYKPITSLDDEICLKPWEYRLLRRWFQMHFAEMEWDFNWAGYFEQKQFNAYTRLMEREDRIPWKIWFPDKKHGKK